MGHPAVWGHAPPDPALLRAGGAAEPWRAAPRGGSATLAWHTHGGLPRPARLDTAPRRGAARRLAATAGGRARRSGVRIGACAARAALDALAYTRYSESGRNPARDRHRWDVTPDRREHWRSRGRSGAALPPVIRESRLADQRGWWTHGWTTSLATVRISDAGGCSRCFFTAHCSAARMTAARYCSGKLAGSSMSSRTIRTMPVSGSVSTCWTRRNPSVLMPRR